MTIKYIFWDSDNTLVDTAAHHWNKHFYTLQKHGIHLDDKWNERIYTNNGGQNWDWMSSELGLNISKDQYLDEIDQWYFDHIGEIKIRDGIEQALDIAETLGIPMGVVSNGRKRSVRAALDAKNLTPHFKFILCIEDYTGRKPMPEPYLAAKTKMQQILGTSIDTSECLVIEDDPKGVEAGIAAGMTVIHREVGNDDTEDFLAKILNFIEP
jgi:beta-phosphoglucomutase